MNNKRSHTIIRVEDLFWRPSNLMKIPNADYLERTGSKSMGARLWRLPPKSANTLHRHVTSEEFFLVLEGTGRMRVDGEFFTLSKYSGVHVYPEQMRQIFNDTDEETLRLVFGAPDDETLPAQGGRVSDFYPVDPTQLPEAMHGVKWPPI